MQLIVSHINADFDAFASMLAAQKLYPDAKAVFPGSQEKKLREFIETVYPFPALRPKDIDIDKVERLIVVDAKSPDRIDALSALLGRSGVDVHVYDHHKHGEDDIKGSVEIIQNVGATTTIFAELLMEKEIAPTPMEATIMGLGIYEETGGLLYPSTTERDLKAAAWLLKCGANLNLISNYLRSGLSVEEVELLNELASTSREALAGGLSVVLAKASRDQYVGDASPLAHRLMDMQSSDAVVIMLNMQGKVLLIGRSRTPELNMAEVLEEFGGGGHPAAASATIRELPLEIIEERLIGSINDHVKPGRFAIDVMTAPVITVDPSLSIKDAEDRLTKFGVNVLPVVSDGRFTGIISREVVEKAKYHGFMDSKVSDFQTTGVATVEKYTPVRDVERVMMEENQRFMPVMDGDRIIGAITRTDMMRSIYEDYLKRKGLGAKLTAEKSYIRKNVAVLIKHRFSAEICDLLRLAGATAHESGFRAYLVGGCVRDLLRGEENLDLDIVVEGDGVGFARKLGKKISARVTVHERFRTAKVIAGPMKIDVATARTEYYESPAALPVVEMSSIKKDLYRRDFTINTLAVKLNPSEFGQLVDFFGSQRDIKEKTIRVLHNLSFVEDPTRAFRAVRFAVRFGFKISKHTENLIKLTLRMGLFERLSGARLYEELRLIFEEREPHLVISHLDQYGLLKAIHPSLELSERLEALMLSLQETLLWFELLFTGDKPDAGRMYLAALLSGLGEAERDAALERLSIPRRMHKAVLADMESANNAIKRMPFKEPAAIYDAFSPMDLEAALLCMALSMDDNKKKEVSRYLLDLRRIRPILTGDDLKGLGVPPGPVYTRILNQVLHEKLSGRLSSKDEELAFVKGRLNIPAPP